MKRIHAFMDGGVDEALFVNDALRKAWAAADRLAEEGHRLETTEEDPNHGLKKLVKLFGDEGLLDYVLGKSDGGIDDAISFSALCMIRERLAYGSALLDLAFAMQGLGTHPISAHASASQRAQVLPAIRRGDSVAAFALTEQEAGSDVSRIQTTATREGADYVLNGTKVYISNAPIADIATVFAATAPQGAPRRLSAFIVDLSTKGVEKVGTKVLGGHPIGELHFDGARVSETMRLGQEGDGMRIALGTLHHFRVTVGAAALGFAGRALDEAKAHVRTREQFGGPLSDLQAVQMKLADMACDLKAAQLLVYRAAKMADELDATDRTERARQAEASSMAKLMATEAAQRVVDAGVQLLGGRGVDERFTLAHLYQDVRALRIYEGASDIQRLLIARHILDT